jgi:hypothetical protein
MSDTNKHKPFRVSIFSTRVNERKLELNCLFLMALNEDHALRLARLRVERKMDEQGLTVPYQLKVAPSSQAELDRFMQQQKRADFRTLANNGVLN